MTMNRKANPRIPRARAAVLVATLVVVGFSAIAGRIAVATTTSVERVAAGNAKYGTGEYEAARAAYEEALAEREESAEILYNLGNVAHRLGEFEAATQHYRDALLVLRGQSGLERKILYNLGNNAYRRGMSQAEEDPEGAIETLNEAAAHYEDVIDRVRSLRGREAQNLAELDAAYNLEIVRIRIKEIQDRLTQDDEEQQEAPPEIADLVTEWLDAERALAARVATQRLVELDDDARMSLAAEIVAKKRELAETATEVLTRLGELRDRAKEAAAAAAGPGPGSGALPSGGAGLPGGAPGAPPPPRPAEAYESALESATFASTANEQLITDLDGAVPSDDALAAAELGIEMTIDPIAATLLAVDPMKGVERTALVATEDAMRMRADTQRLDASDAAGRAFATTRQSTNVSRAQNLATLCDAFATEMQAQLDAAAAANGAAPGPATSPRDDGPPTDDEPPLPSKEERLLEALRFGATEAGAAQQNAAVALEIFEEPSPESVDAPDFESAIGEQSKAVEHLAAAHAAIEDALKNWVTLLQDAVDVEEAVVQITRAVKDVEARGEAGGAGEEASEAPSADQVASAGAAALAAQTDNIERTRRVLQGLGEQLAQSQAMQQMLAQQGQAGGAPGGGTPGGGTPGGSGPGGSGPGAAPQGPGATGPDYEEIDGLVREALAAEREACDLLAASQVAAADPPATLALEKLREALDKANPDQDEQQKSQEQDDQGQDGESDESQPPEDPEGEPGEPDEPEDPQDSDPQEEEETPAEPAAPEESEDGEPQPTLKLTPEEAAELLMKMLAEQEQERDALLERYPKKRKPQTPVVKDW